MSVYSCILEWSKRLNFEWKWLQCEKCKSFNLPKCLNSWCVISFVDTASQLEHRFKWLIHFSILAILASQSVNLPLRYQFWSKIIASIKNISENLKLTDSVQKYGQFQGYDARKVNCVHIETSSLWAEFVNKNRCIVFVLYRRRLKSLHFDNFDNSHKIVSYDQNSSFFYVRLRHPSCAYITAQKKYNVLQKMRSRTHLK